MRAVGGLDLDGGCGGGGGGGLGLLGMDGVLSGIARLIRGRVVIVVAVGDGGGIRGEEGGFARRFHGKRGIWESDIAGEE